MDRLLNACESVLTYTAALSTFAMMVVMTADAGGRYLLNRPIMGVYEITQNYLMVASVFLAMGYAYRQGAYIRVTFFVDRLPRQVTRLVTYLVQAVSLVYGVILVVATMTQALRVIGTGTTLSTVDLPLGPAYVLVPVGLCFMSLLMLLDLGRVRTGGSSQTS